MQTGECGIYHLTPAGWTRKDRAPFPSDRIETWVCEIDQPSTDAKEQVRLTRLWIAPGTKDADCARLHRRFGEAIVPSHDRLLTLSCQEDA